MKLYHGSYTKIDKIDLSKCNPNKDFGQGFYATKFRQHAEIWADIVGKKNNAKGFVSEFDYTETGFAKQICKIKHFDKYDEEWLDFVVMNRDKKNDVPMHDYDIVEGPVANDKVQFTLDAYLKGKITKDKFLDMLKHHEETHQICFCTINALQMLDEVDTENDIDYELHLIGEQITEQLMLDFGFNEDKATDLFFSSATFGQLAEKSTGFYLKTWQEIYQLLKKELNQCE
ncbi:hypothetical protein FACS189434_12430 [Bacteroidia bacterium]|nr:hypothetical protein FACS189434_12430 [Bacteroidia bacterium]